jgi:hypothetical protein
MPRHINLSGDLANRAKRIGAFVHPPLAPYIKLQARLFDRAPCRVVPALFSRE